MSSTETESGVVAELALAADRKPQIVTLEHGSVKAEVLLTPNEGGGYAVQLSRDLLADLQVQPERRKGTAVFTEIDSFISHANRFKDESSAIFLRRVSRSQMSLVSVLDYHCKGATGEPRFGGHRGVYEFPLSDEWIAWTGRSGKSFSVEDFARWIEDRLMDVASPSSGGERGKLFAETLGMQFCSAAKLLELSKGLELHVGHRVKETKNLQTGERVVIFEEMHADAVGQPVKIPNAFLIGIPVFRGDAGYPIPVRLRYRAGQGSILWSFELHGVDDVLDHAVKEARKHVAEKTGLPVFEGSPE